jgi:hypothetical protein
MAFSATTLANPSMQTAARRIHILRTLSPTLNNKGMFGANGPERGNRYRKRRLIGFVLTRNGYPN